MVPEMKIDPKYLLDLFSGRFFATTVLYAIYQKENYQRTINDIAIADLSKENYVREPRGVLF